jgi:hypothetical protein
MPNDNEDNFSELRPSSKKLEHAGLCSHPEFGYPRIGLPNLNDLPVSDKKKFLVLR